MEHDSEGVMTVDAPSAAEERRKTWLDALLRLHAFYEAHPELIPEKITVTEWALGGLQPGKFHRLVELLGTFEAPPGERGQNSFVGVTSDAFAPHEIRVYVDRELVGRPVQRTETVTVMEWDPELVGGAA